MFDVAYPFFGASTTCARRNLSGRSEDDVLAVDAALGHLLLPVGQVDVRTVVARSSRVAANIFYYNKQLHPFQKGQILKSEKMKKGRLKAKYS